MTTRLMLGNEAVARGAYEHGVRVAAAYPGTPSSEILESIAQYEEVYAEWSVNEAVAYEVAFGAAVGGVRALTAMKSPGLNVAADPMISSVYTGVNGGLVVVCGSDPGMDSSSTEQDDRYFGRLAGIPILEPSDSQECKDFVGVALELSEAFDIPVMVRLTTDIAHAKSLVRLGERVETERRDLERSPAKYCLVPVFSRELHRGLAARLAGLRDYAENDPLTRVEPGTDGLGRLGIIASGAAYLAAKEAAPDARFLKLGLVNPLPIEAVRRFAECVDRLFVVEELEPFLEEQILAAGITAEGKAFFPSQGKLTPQVVGRGLVEAGVALSRWRRPRIGRDAGVIPRPPIFCAGCPHRGMVTAIRRMGLYVNGDIGCYDSCCLPPTSAMDTVVAMGASISMAQGVGRAGGHAKGALAVIGDSTFFHSGVAGLLNAVHQKTNVTLLIQDNSITAMTGGQTNPGCEGNLAGVETPRVDLPALCRALGVESVQTVDPYDLAACTDALMTALAFAGPSVVITNRPCTLFPRKVRADKTYEVDDEACTACQLCMKLACPAIYWTDSLVKKRHKVAIDAGACTGCSICAQVCPVEAISKAND
jgi:indolepyruvate ferredoxin oxidoreductase, alpha subunit